MPVSAAKPEKHNKSRPHWQYLCALGVLTAIAYFNSFGLGAAMDGRRLLNDSRLASATAENLRLIFQEHYWWPMPVDRLYRPVTLLSLLFDGTIAGSQEPSVFHFVNFLFHLVNV